MNTLNTKHWFPITCIEVGILVDWARSSEWAALLLDLGFKPDRGSIAYRGERGVMTYERARREPSNPGGIILLSYDEGEMVGESLDQEFPDPDTSVFTGNKDLDDKILALMMDLDIVYDQENQE